MQPIGRTARGLAKKKKETKTTKAPAIGSAWRYPPRPVPATRGAAAQALLPFAFAPSRVARGATFHAPRACAADGGGGGAKMGRPAGGRRGRGARRGPMASPAAG